MQLVLTNLSHMVELQAINNIIYQLTALILVFGLFTLRKDKFWQVSTNQLIFECFLLLVFLISFLKQDFGAFKLVLTDFVLLYFLMFGRRTLTINLSLINTLFLVQVCFEVLNGLAGLNKYAYFPFLGDSIGFAWQVSLFPNGQTPMSGAISFLVLILNGFSNGKHKFYYIALSSFFLIFSGSRTILLIAGLVGSMSLIRYLFPRLSASKLLVATYALPILSMFFFLGFLLLSSSGNAFFMEFLFRNFIEGEMNFENLDRVLLIQSYWNEFVSNPLLGILSTKDFSSFADLKLKNVPTRGTETRLLYYLATFGITYIIFLFFIFKQQLKSLRAGSFHIASIWVFYFISLLLYGSYMRGYTLIGLLVFYTLSNRINIRFGKNQVDLVNTSMV